MKAITLAAVVLILAGCGGPDSQFGEQIESASLIIERHQDTWKDPAGMTYAELFDRNARDVAQLSEIEQEVRRVGRDQPSEAVEAALDYVRSVQGFIRSSERMYRAELNVNGVRESAPPSNEFALAYHADDQRGMQRAQERSRRHIAALGQAIDDYQAAVDSYGDAIAGLEEARERLAIHLPERRLFRRDLFGEADADPDPSKS